MIGGGRDGRGGRGGTGLVSSTTGLGSATGPGVTSSSSASGATSSASNGDEGFDAGVVVLTIPRSVTANFSGPGGSFMRALEAKHSCWLWLDNSNGNVSAGPLYPGSESQAEFSRNYLALKTDVQELATRAKAPGYSRPR